MDDIKRFAIAGASASVSVITTNPLDVVKVRMQLTHAAQGTKVRMLDTLTSIVRVEGWTALFRGVSPAILRACTYGSLRFGLYDPIKKSFSNQSSLGVKVAAGCTSGAFAALLTNPIEMLKVRSQLAVDPSQGKSAWQLAKHIWRTEGPSAFSRGLSASMQRSAALTAGQMSSYDEIKHRLQSSFQLPDSTRLQVFTAFICSLVTTTVTSPFDVIKTRMMGQQASRTYRSTLHCLSDLVRTEGAWTLFRGWLPNYTRQGPATIIILSMTAAEETDGNGSIVIIIYDI
jgi:hypothetical protein